MRSKITTIVLLAALLSPSIAFAAVISSTAATAS